MAAPDRQWLRRFITANLRLYTRDERGPATSEIAVSIGEDIGRVNEELRQMRSEGLVTCSQVRSGASSHWRLAAMAGKEIRHLDGDPRNLDPSSLEIRESGR